MAIDTWWWNTVLLMHMDGANNGTTFTDEVYSAAFPNAVLRVGGSVVTSTSSPKYGTASGYFPGANGDWLRVFTGATADLPLGSNYNFYGGNFTIECWFKADNVTRDDMTMLSTDDGTYPAGSWELRMNDAGASTGDIAFYVRDYHATSPMMVSSSSGYDDNAWHHVAVTRNEDRWKMFVDGATQASVTSTITFTEHSSHYDDDLAVVVAGFEVRVGNSGGRTSRGWTGYLDDVRITKGHARYTVPFTAPTAAFPDDADTGSRTGATGDTGPNGVALPGLPGDDGGVSVKPITLPAAPAQYDPNDQRQVRRIIESAFR